MVGLSRALQLYRDLSYNINNDILEPIIYTKRYIKPYIINYGRPISLRLIILLSFSLLAIEGYLQAFTKDIANPIEK